VWRHYTVPAAGEPGAETWAGNSYETGGAPTWSIGAYDAETDTLYWPTGNPAPVWNGDMRKGDNLYSDSILALDAKTGKRKWHFQATPHDVWDYDGNSEVWLVDITHDGSPRKAIVQANRNGFFYILDRNTGEFLKATPYVDKMNWATGVDEKGRPIVDPERVPRTKAEGLVRICPGAAGGNNAAYAGSINPDLGLAFFPSIESCFNMEKAEAVFVKGVPFFGGWFESPDRDEGTAYGNILAVDVATGERRWAHRERLPVMAGTLSTAGGVVITGNSEGHALAFDSETGEELWRFSTGSGIRSQPMAYELGGKTYVAIGSGGGGLVQAVVGLPTSLPHGSTLFVFELR
jgi:alcohol dehydrogenase (cytochrome c)